MESWRVIFYTDSEDNSPIDEFVTRLPEKEQYKVYYTIKLLKTQGIYLREPYTKKVHAKSDLFELRVKYSNNIQRILYFHYTGKTFVLLHGFTKKTQKTPRNEIEIALKRKEDYLRRNKDV